MTLALSADQTRSLRLRAQRLLPNQGERDNLPDGVLRDVIGLQAQDLNAAQLSMRARSVGLTAVRVEQARQVERSIVWTWCMRGTLHLITAKDAAWLIPLLGPQFIQADQRRMRQLGWTESSAAAGIQLIYDELIRRGQLTRADIVQLLQAKGLPSEGQAPIHLIYRAAMEGLLCYGPGPANNHNYVLFESGLGRLQPLPKSEALANLAYRYLEAYAPASPADLASWSGVNLQEARQAWKLISSELKAVEVAGEPAWLLKTQIPWIEEALDTTPGVRLMPRFDTLWLGYEQRDWLVDTQYARRIHPGGGIIHSFLLVNGRILGSWTTRQRKRIQEVLLELFEELPNELIPRIEAEVADLGRFLGEEAVLLVDQESATRGKQISQHKE